jgi:aspartyl protease family protein
MKPLVIFAAVIIAVGAFVAHYADKALVNPVQIQKSGQTNTSTSSSDSMSATSSGRNLSSLPQSNSMPNPQSITSPPSANTPPKPQLPQVVTLSRSVTLRDDGKGHFQTNARVDGLRVDFMVDTGASMVTLRKTTAAQLGFHPGERDFTVQIQTANGVVKGAVMRLNMVEVETIVVRDVQAFVLPDEILQTNLLGMTFLSRVRWTYDRGRFVIEQ